MLDSGSTMEIIQLIIGIALLISVKIILFKIFYGRIRFSKLPAAELKFEPIRSIYKQIKKEGAPKAEKIQKYAENLEYRTLIYDALQMHHKTNLFPKALLTIKKSSESYLANWLNMHDDFDSLPDEIQFEEQFTLANDVTFLLFKFKVYEPHLYANKGWMLAYVGYKTATPDAYLKPDYILSNFENKQISNTQLESLV